MRTVLLIAVAAAALAAPPSASALCSQSSERQRFDRAEVVFVGIAIRGPNANGQLLSPARFWVVGEPWKIFGARSRSGVVRTSRCTGSRRFGSIDTFVG